MPTAPLDSPRKRRVAAWFIGGLIAASPLQAQQGDESLSAEAMIVQANQYFGLGRRPVGCQPGLDGEIVVCARFVPDPRFEPMAPPAAEPKMIALGAPPTGRGVGVGMVVRGCFLQKCPKELYFIDMKAIPEPPPGSDAEMIALGLMRAP